MVLIPTSVTTHCDWSGDHRVCVCRHCGTPSQQLYRHLISSAVRYCSLLTIYGGAMCIGIACVRITLGRSNAGMVGVYGHKPGEVSLRCRFVVLSGPNKYCGRRSKLLSYFSVWPKGAGFQTLLLRLTCRVFPLVSATKRCECGFLSRQKDRETGA